MSTYPRTCNLYHSQNLKYFLESSISLQQNKIFLGTQAFASPPDMASSGVWEAMSGGLAKACVPRKI